MSLYEELTFDKFDQELGTAGLAKTHPFSNRRWSGVGLIAQALLPQENGFEMLYYYEHQTGMIIKFR